MPPDNPAALRARYETALADVEAVTTGNLVARFLDWTQRYCTRRCGSSTFTNTRDATRELLAMYATTPADSFSPVQLRAVRSMMVDVGLARTTVNDRVNRIRRIWKWGVEQGLVAESMLAALQAVSPLQVGRSPAREPEPVHPVTWQEVLPVLPAVRPPVAAMILIQWWSAARPGEVAGLRGEWLDTSSEPWVYTLEQHKTRWCGRIRRVYFGPQAQNVLCHWLRGNGPIFGYRVSSYGNAIRRACRRLDVPEWCPQQLRHSALTRIRDTEGVEAARAVAGHSLASTTEIYSAEVDGQLAAAAAMRLG